MNDAQLQKHFSSSTINILKSIWKSKTIFRHLFNYTNIHTLNSLFKALNDPTRREILEMLKESDMTAGEIAERFNMTKPSISHHLDLLKQAGLVIHIRNGQFINYSLNASVLDELLGWFLQFQQKPKQKK